MNVDVLVHTINTLATLIKRLAEVAKDDPQAWDKVKDGYNDALKTFKELEDAHKRS